MKLRLLFVVLCFFIGTNNTFSQGQIGQDIDGESIAFDYSGTSVSLSSDGNTIAIGAPNNEGKWIMMLVMFVFMRIMEALGLK
jgi:hypothetical protein